MAEAWGKTERGDVRDLLLGKDIGVQLLKRGYRYDDTPDCYRGRDVAWGMLGELIRHVIYTAIG